jgi:hypothetical protein
VAGVSGRVQAGTSDVGQRGGNPYLVVAVMVMVMVVRRMVLLLRARKGFGEAEHE